MLSDVKEYYGLSRGFLRYGFNKAFETQSIHKMTKELSSSLKEGNLIVVSGIMGIGKSTTMRIVKEKMAKDKNICVSRSLSLERHKVNLVTLMTAIFSDLSVEKKFKIPSQPEKRERILCELIAKKQKPVALFIDEAHDLNGKTLIGLKRMIETVQENSRGVLSIVLIGHPRLRNSMRRSPMEEVGARTECFEIEGMTQEEKTCYIKWLIAECSKKGSKIDDLIDKEAIELLSVRLATPLQIEQNLELAFSEGYKVGQSPVNAEIIESIIAKDLDEVEATLARLGYNNQTLAEVLNIRRLEAKHFITGKLNSARAEELRSGLLAAGIPI